MSVTVPACVTLYVGSKLQEIFDDLDSQRDYVRTHHNSDATLLKSIDDVSVDLMNFRHMIERKYDLYGDFYHNAGNDACSCTKCKGE